MSDLELDEAPQTTTTNEILFGKSTYPSSALRPAAVPIAGVRIGVLAGVKEDGCALVLFPGQHETAAIVARSTVDLHGAHVGREIVLMFEEGDPRRPIVLGCLSRADVPSRSYQPTQVEIDADGDRIIVSAKKQLVLRCGKATITLTKAGKVLIQGTYVSSHASGVNRVKGGSVQIN